jgi:hypothetical protein
LARKIILVGVGPSGTKAANIRILSDSTADVDRGEKKIIYQEIWRVPEYFWFDPATEEFAGFRLSVGEYEAIEPNARNWLWSDELGLFLGVHDSKLRLFSAGGTLLPLPEEDAIQQAEQERQRADLAEQQLQREREARSQLLEKLRSLPQEQRKALGLE